jgi:large repetitive protein
LAFVMKFPALLIALLVLGLVAASGVAAGAGPVVLSGHVQHPSGLPFVGANITVRNVDTNSTLSPILTDASGNYTTPTLAAGTYAVTASYPHYNANTTYSGLSSSSSAVDFTIYEILGTVTGQVTDGNTTLSGVRITLTNGTANFTALSTAPLGRFTMENVTEGAYTAYAVKDGYDGVSGIYPGPVVVSKGSTVELNFTLTALANQPAQLGGTVNFDGEPLSGVKVVLAQQGGTSLTITTDAQGNYLFKGVTAGQYEVLFSKSGYVGTSQKVTLEPLKEKNVDVTMKKDALPGNSGFLMDYDLAHSLMIVALGLALFTTLAALFIRYRAGNRPEILETEDESSD